MPWNTELWVNEPIEPTVEGDTVKVVIASGKRTITLRTSRNAARDFAVRLLNSLNAADHEQSAAILRFKAIESDDH